MTGTRTIIFGHCHMSHCYVKAGRVKKKINELDSYWTAEEGLPCQQWLSDMGTEISLNLILPVKIPYPQVCPLRPFGHKSNATGDVEVLN